MPVEERTERRCALVTGSSRGIGRSIAVALAKEGCNIVVNGVRPSQQGTETVTLCKDQGVEAAFCRASVADAEGRSALVDFARTRFGRLDVLVNNAGVGPEVRGDILQATEESFDRVIGINLKGPYFLTQAVAAWMVAQKTQHPERTMMIVNISSISAYTASPERGEYCVSKAGMSMMTKLFAVRLAGEGINVYEVRPGVVATDMTAKVREKYDRLIEQDLYPIRRWGHPEDVGKAVAGLARGVLPFSTGEVLNVDGGFHLRRL